MNTIWILFIILIFILSIKLFFKQHFDSLNIIKIIKNIDFNNVDSLCLFLGTKMGVGVFLSISIALFIGGPSSIIWIILFSIFTSSINYEEAYLGYKYKKNNSLGPSSYIKNKYISLIYVILFLITYTFLFMMIQTNTVYNIINININVNKYIIFLLFSFLLTTLLIFNNSEILSLLNKLVLFMCVLILLLFTYVIIINISNLDDVIKLVIYDLNNKFSILSGLITSIVISIKRSIFESELLLGTTSISSSKSSSINHSISMSMIGYYFIIFISVLTSIIILLYQLKYPINDNYFILISNVFKYHFGSYGSILLIILFLLFSLTTIISGYYFGINYIDNINYKFKFIYRILMIGFSLCGILFSEGIIWKLVDVFMLVLMFINLISILLKR